MLTAFETIFWASIGILTYTYLGYPLLLAVISRLISRRSPEPGYTPSLSVLIAAYNEEVGIRAKIERTLALDYPRQKLEILVLSDGSTDRTDEIVKSISDPRVRLLRVEGRKGKTNAQNEGVMCARGEVLVFSDATTIYHPQALLYLACNYSDPRVGAVSGRYQYLDSDGKSPTGLGTVAFWNYENFIKIMQSRIRTISGCCGCIYSVRREAYTALAPEVISDLVQPLHVIQQGYRVVFEDRAVAYEETTQSTSEEFSMRVRVVTRGMRGLLSVPRLLMPWRFGWVSFQLWSHKLLRWSVPFFLLLILTSNVLLAGTSFYRPLLLAQVVFYAVTCFSLVIPLQRVWKPLGIPLYFCTLNAAAFLSVLEVLRGKKYVVWETVRT
ncbi:MAG: glycosyltransferase, CESA-like subfamily [Candidatus Acidoferrum typicum]|nr:glycosyltransferase, CESA-like subfamily [Candidatus Acidoferrum typicum]